MSIYAYLVTLIMFLSFAAGAYFIFIDKKERHTIGYCFTFLAMIVGVLHNFFAN